MCVEQLTYLEANFRRWGVKMDRRVFVYLWTLRGEHIYALRTCLEHGLCLELRQAFDLWTFAVDQAFKQMDIPALRKFLEELLPEFKLKKKMAIP